MEKAKNAIVVLLDSLNRHMIGDYGGTEFETPNIDRFAQRAVRFNRHFTGSLPCMPARHDILCGALDFLWKPWGSIELWEAPITAHLREKNVNTMLFTDHPHLFETGGENYHTDFYAWEYLRGHEGDPWKSRPDPSWMGAPALPASKRPAHYDESRTWFRSELDFPGPKTMQATANWLNDNAGHHDQFLVYVDEFDPHEPFDTPAPWVNRYDETWTGEQLIWPPYGVRNVERGVITEREGRHIRCNYGSKLSMIDHWFGKVLDAIDQNGLWDDTMVILCTDHGHYLGEKDTGVSPACLNMNLSVIPLFTSPTPESTRVKSTLCRPMSISTRHYAISLTSRCNMTPMVFRCYRSWLANDQVCGSGRWEAFSVIGYRSTTAIESTRGPPSTTGFHCHFGPIGGRPCLLTEPLPRGRCRTIVRCWILCPEPISR